MPVQHLSKRRSKIVSIAQCATKDWKCPVCSGREANRNCSSKLGLPDIAGLPVNEWVIVSMERFKTIFTGKHRLNLKEYKAIGVPGRFSHPCLGVFHPRMIGLPRSHIHGVIEMRALYHILYLVYTYLYVYIYINIISYRVARFITLRRPMAFSHQRLSTIGDPITVDSSTIFNH